jgi:hypothetical protein
LVKSVIRAALRKAMTGAFAVVLSAAGAHGQAVKGYLGFDRNDYPGDAAIAQLRKEFSFAGYWLTPAPHAATSSWSGKRKLMAKQGWGFLLLARGRAVDSVRTVAESKLKGASDARSAARRALAEGFGRGAIIFLDVEDGGRLPAPFHAYLQAWADELIKLRYRPGVYCSGMPVDEGEGMSIVTAEDIRANEKPREFAFWVFNDACPPSPGCVSLENPPVPSVSGVKDATVWQFVRSPREKETAGKCAGYAADGNCYAVADAAKKWHLDLNVAASANPSFGASDVN